MGVVEGLDVDRDRFDKFLARRHRATPRRTLAIDECVESVARLGETSDGKRLFDDFAGACSATSCTSCRIPSIAWRPWRRWNARWRTPTRGRGHSPRSREKERFLRGQERAAKKIHRSHAYPRVAQLVGVVRIVFRGVGRSDVVAGAPRTPSFDFSSRSSDRAPSARTSVADPKKYGFDPKRLVSALREFTVRLDGVAGGFAERLAAEEDYDAGVMEAARDVLVRDAFGAAFVPPRLRDIIDRCARIRGEEGREDGGGSSMHGGDEMKNAASASPRDGTTSGEGSWSSSALLSLLGPDPYPDESAEETAYKSTMGPKTFAEADGGHPSGPFRSSTPRIPDAGRGVSRAKQKKLAREAAALAEGQLPCELGSSVFLRHDPDRFDRQRASSSDQREAVRRRGVRVGGDFTGGTPRRRPCRRPRHHGGGRHRLTSNLYADGKVRLSLLGTCHGGALEEKRGRRRRPNCTRPSRRDSSWWTIPC